MIRIRSAVFAVLAILLFLPLVAIADETSHDEEGRLVESTDEEGGVVESSNWLQSSSPVAPESLTTVKIRSVPWSPGKSSRWPPATTSPAASTVTSRA